MNRELNFDSLLFYLEEAFGYPSEKINVSQLPGGYSNLSFLVETPDQRMILRRPPFGEKIAKAHDMSREFQVLSSLKKAGYTKSPSPLLLCEEEDVFGAPFFVMEYIEGYILRAKIPDGLHFGAKEFSQLSKNAVEGLLELHHLELHHSGLIDLGKPEGYTQRQVLGWTDRYQRAKTHELPELEETASWLSSHFPKEEPLAFIHNDYKYDNLVLALNDPTCLHSVLDWEMATVGNPLMDLGTTLAYWAEAEDPTLLKQFNLSFLPGNFSRAQLIDYYFSKSKLKQENMIFYYAFGLFKVAAIAQQIFKRFSQGFASGHRFAKLILVVEAAGKKALESIHSEKI